MKNLVLIAISLVALNARAVPTCYGNPDVNQEAPFLLTLSNINEFQLGLILEDLNSGPLVQAKVVFDFANLQILELSLDSTNPNNTNLNDEVAKKIAAIAKKYKLTQDNIVLECNGEVHANPRAGGMNGN